ncbi:uncharacterized protein LOC132031939 [Lycium ferocissimum]|uniref:uncharacterized protein LOC132031939 n=1 Tax=Lycium ferocissimum TaxID=112874 RepID=UPI002815D4EF|nr:uncharacterized protein LOC132031939 [Lycium ferocissimum]
MKRYFSTISSKLPQPSSFALNISRVEENLNQLEENHHSAKRQKQGVDLDSLLADPKKRISILDYHPDERDEIRRAYIQRRPHQLQLPMFSQTDFYGYKYESIHQGGGETFSSIGFKSWHKKKRLDKHVGELNSDHNEANMKCEHLMRQEQSIQVAFVKPYNKTKLEHIIRLKASIEVVRLLLNQGLAFRGQREDESSINKGYLKKCFQVKELVLLVSNVLNVVRCSFKRMDELRKSQAEKVQEALDMGVVETGKGLNQELDLARAANTCWGSHYKSFKKFISMFVSITDVLDTIVVDSECEYRAKAPGFLRVCQTFEIAFILHLMRDILEITNELNESL